MIHTAELFTYIDEFEIYKLTSKYNESITLIGDIINEQLDDGISICFRKCNMRAIPWQVNIFIDAIKLLNKTDITDDDYQNIQQKIDKNLSIVFNKKTKDLTLKRIEYRFDSKLNNNIEKETLLHIYQKMKCKVGYKRKRNIMSNEKPKDFAGTIYLESKSITSIIYDKEKERRDKNKKIEEYERLTLRYEVKLKNRHLNYNKNMLNIDKTLESYFSSSLKGIYMKQHLEKGLYRGDYYKLYRAEKIISASDLSDKSKRLLREFLIDVSKLGITGTFIKTKDNGKNKYSQYMLKKIIDELEILNINPILIPKNLVTKYGKAPSYIKNPFETDKAN